MVGRTDSDTTLLICGSRGHEARIRTPGYEHSRVVDLDGDGSAEIIDGGTGVWSRSGFVIDWDGDSFSLIDWPDSTLRWEGITPLALTDGFDPDPDAADRKVLDWDCLPDEPEADLWISRIAVSESGPEEFEWFLRLDEGRAVTINKLHGSVPSDVPATADELAAGRSCAAFE